MESTAALKRIRTLYEKVIADPDSTSDAIELAQRVMELDARLCLSPDFPRDWIPF
jgi:hypothetical protein